MGGQHKMNTEKKLIPLRRFPEFKDKEEWQEYKLGDIAQFYKGKGISKNDVSDNGKTPCIRYGELYTYYKEIIRKIKSYTDLPTKDLFLSEANDVVIPSSGETKEDISTASCVLYDDIALGGDINVIRTINDGVFLSYYLNNAKKQDIAKIAQGISIIHLYNEQLRNLSVEIPCLSEQQKIADCLSSIDSYISSINEKIEQLKAHKKSLMQKLFPQNGQTVPEYRFPEFKSAGVWKEIMLGDVFSRITERNKKNSQNVLTISAQNGLVSQYDYFHKSIAASDISNYYLIQNGDFAYNKSRSQGYPFGVIRSLRLYDEGVVSTLYICFRIKSDKYSVNFFDYYFETELINYEIGKIAQEGARNHGLLNISTDDFFNKVVLMVPSSSEQQKIAECLSSIDKAIIFYSQKASLLEQHKKGLIQQLFPKQ